MRERIVFHRVHTVRSAQTLLWLNIHGYSGVATRGRMRFRRSSGRSFMPASRLNSDIVDVVYSIDDFDMLINVGGKPFLTEEEKGPYQIDKSI